MTYPDVFGAALVAALLAVPLTAYAGALTIDNDTAITAYNGAKPTKFFPGPNPYVDTAPIGADFLTSSLTLTATSKASDVILNLMYTTRFSGFEVIDGVTVANADIFLTAGNTDAGHGLGYAISLGDQARNGGLAAGFYSVRHDLTSQDIWKSRTDFVYGGAFGASDAYEPGKKGYAATATPTVITSGTWLGNAAIKETALRGGWYQLDAQITLTAAEAATFSHGMDVFWGTGDCGNGSFLAQVSALPVSEPCSLAVLASGVFYLLARRRGRPASNGFGVQRVAGGAHGAH